MVCIGTRYWTHSANCRNGKRPAVPGRIIVLALARNQSQSCAQQLGSPLGSLPAMLKTRSLVTETALRTLLVIGGIAASLLIAEGLLRLGNYSYQPLKIEVMHKSEWRPKHAFRDRHFVHDPALIWRPRVGFSPFNSQGYRGREVALAKGAHEFRILAVGDSNTLGWKGPSGPNWPGDLQQLFDVTTANVTVVNAGVYGYTVFQGLERFKQASSTKPDMALISFGSNDAHLVTASDSDFVNRPKQDQPNQ